MIHPNTEIRFISEEIGYGVVATTLIPAGTITWALDKFDRSFSPSEVEKMEPFYQEIIERYCFRNNQGKLILCWDSGRFVNHSFNSNCLTTSYDFEIAIRDIEPGEQLTDDYGYLNISAPLRGIDEGTRRKVVYPDDLLRNSDTWDKKLLKVFHKIPSMAQPLKVFIAAKNWQEVEKISKGQSEMKSIRENYYDPMKKIS